MTQINSQQFYTTIEENLLEAARQIEESGAPIANFYIWFTQDYSSPPQHKLHFTIDPRRSGAKVENGKHLQECVDEYIRRNGFERRQQAVLLTAPVPATSELTNEAEFEETHAPEPPPSDPMQDDEIPF